MPGLCGNEFKTDCIFSFTCIYRPLLVIRLYATRLKAVTCCCLFVLLCQTSCGLLLCNQAIGVGTSFSASAMYRFPLPSSLGTGNVVPTLKWIMLTLTEQYSPLYRFTQKVSMPTTMDCMLCDYLTGSECIIFSYVKWLSETLYPTV